jgi:hypothetical protein
MKQAVTLGYHIVICKDYVILLRQRNLGSCGGLGVSRIGKTRNIQNFGGKNLFRNIQLTDREGDGDIGCEDGRWMELAHYHIQFRILVLAVLNLPDLLSQ